MITLKPDALPSQHLPPKSTFKIKISKKDNSKEIRVEEIKVKEEKDKDAPKEKIKQVRLISICHLAYTTNSLFEPTVYKTLKNFRVLSCKMNYCVRPVFPHLCYLRHFSDAL